MKNRAFCDTSMTFGTQLLCPMKTCFKTGPQPDFVCGCCGSHFQNGWHEFSMSHISANYNIDRKLIIVSMSLFSGSHNPNMAIILVCGGCGSHFQNGWHAFSMSHISANIIDMKLILAPIYMFPGSRNPKYDKQKGATNCFLHQNGPWSATLWDVVAITATQENDSCFTFVSTVEFSCVAANVCYYFECYSIICYVDKQHIRPVLFTATTLSNVSPIYRVCQHFHCTVMIIGLLILVKHNYLKLSNRIN